jgi:hypothetical protein
MPCAVTSRRLSSRPPWARRLPRWTARPWICLAAALATLLHSGGARADDPCPEGPAVELAVELEPEDVALRARLERQIRAELAARQIRGCRGDAVRGEPWLAQLWLRAEPPELGLAHLRVQTRAGTAVDRELQLSRLPRAARPSAIATAADELLAAALAEPARPPTPAPAVATASPGSEVAVARAPLPPEPYASGLVALGLGAAVSGFLDSSSMYGASLALRLRPLPRLSITLGVGYGSGWQGLPGAARLGELPANVDAVSVRPRGLPEGVRSSIGYAHLDLGVELLAAGPWELSAHAGARAARSALRLEYAPEVTEGRIGFGARDGNAGLVRDPNEPLPAQGRPTDHATDLLGSAGVEGRWETGAWSLAASLLALVPLRSSDPDDFEFLADSTSPREGHGASLGAELRLGAWFFGAPEVTPK